MSSDFKGVLEMRTEVCEIVSESLCLLVWSSLQNLKRQKQRREQFSTAPLSLMNSPMSGEGVSH